MDVLIKPYDLIKIQFYKITIIKVLTPLKTKEAHVDLILIYYKVFDRETVVVSRLGTVV